MSQGDIPSGSSQGQLPFVLATPVHTAITTTASRQRSISPSPYSTSPVTSLPQLTSTLSLSSATESSAFAHLPEELVEQILLLAARRHPSTNVSLALTSRSVCKLTAKARWETIVLTRAESVAALWRLLVSLDARSGWSSSSSADASSSSTTAADEEVRLYLDQDLGWAPSSVISLPSAKPGDYVRHFFLQLPRSRILELSDALLAASSARAELEAALLASQGAPFDVVQQVKLAPTRSWARLDGLLELMPSIEVLDLGAAETQLLRPSLLRARPRELTLSYDGDDSILATMTWISHATSLRGAPRSSARNDAFVGAPLMTRPHFDGLRSRLERLHIVAVDPRAEVAGIPFTVGLFEPLRRGSVRRGSLINTLAVAARAASVEGATEEPTWWNQQENGDEEEEKREERFSCGLTHLRYDTRRFSFKPPEIFAARLRPFFMELSAAPPAQRARATQYVHTGARHAAPPRGAGAAHATTSNEAAPTAERDSTETTLLREWGAGGLERLHFAWEPGSVAASASSSSSSAASPSTPVPVGADSGGWPSERRGAWTDRSGRAPAFATELIEAIEQLYGWSPTRGAASDAGEYTLEMRAGWSDQEREFLAETQAALERACERVRPKGPPDAALRRTGITTATTTGKEESAEAQATKVHFAVRPPGSVLKLGGIAAFDPARRLALFLDRVRGGAGAWA